MNKLLTILLTVAALSLAIPASAKTCAPTTSPAVAFGDEYVVADACQPGCIASVWIYQESNHMPGLQRDDATQDDTCAGLVPSDTIVM